MFLTSMTETNIIEELDDLPDNLNDLYLINEFHKRYINSDRKEEGDCLRFVIHFCLLFKPDQILYDGDHLLVYRKPFYYDNKERDYAIDIPYFHKLVDGDFEGYDILSYGYEHFKESFKDCMSEDELEGLKKVFMDYHRSPPKGFSKRKKIYFKGDL